MNSVPVSCVFQEGKNPLDATSVHPESYAAAGALLDKLGYKTKDVAAGNLLGLSLLVRDYKKMAKELGNR